MDIKYTKRWEGQADFFIYDDFKIGTANEIFWRMKKGEKIVESVHYYDKIERLHISLEIIPYERISEIIPREKALAVFREMQKELDYPLSPTDSQIILQLRKWRVSNKIPVQNTKANHEPVKKMVKADDRKPIDSQIKRMAEARKVKAVARTKQIEPEAIAIMKQLKIIKWKDLEGLREAEQVAKDLGIDISRAKFKEIRDRYQRLKESRKDRILNTYISGTAV